VSQAFWDFDDPSGNRCGLWWLVSFSWSCQLKPGLKAVLEPAEGVLARLIRASLKGAKSHWHAWLTRGRGGAGPSTTPTSQNLACRDPGFGMRCRGVGIVILHPSDFHVRS
jgi:hypothetical protein